MHEAPVPPIANDIFSNQNVPGERPIVAVRELTTAIFFFFRLRLTMATILHFLIEASSSGAL
jgi:hypothetical protein